MFYIWLLSSSLLLFLTIIQVSGFLVGLIPFNTSFILLLALTITTLSMTKKEYKLEHKTYDTLNSIGQCIFFYGLFVAFTFNRFSLPFAQLMRFEYGSILTIMGYYISRYNSTVSKEKPKEIEIKNNNLIEDKSDKFFEAVYEIEQLLLKESVRKNKDFYNDLEQIETVLIELESKNYPLSNTLLNQVIELFQTYSELIEENIQTDDLVETLVNIESVTKELVEAFNLLYQKAISSKLTNANAQIIALSQHLKINGLANSDFNQD